MENEFDRRRLLKYSEYNESFTTKICLKDGRVIIQPYLGVLTIGSKEPLRIGIDQSSSQTGVAVKTSNGELLALLDFVNTSKLPYPIYRSMLGLKIEQLFWKTTADICVVEKMWGGNKNAYEILSELAKFLQGFKYLIPGWSHTEVAEILPNVWRKGYFNNRDEYKGMYTKDKVKQAALMEGIRRYPQLENYGYNHQEMFHVNDSFDALGIIEGYEALTFSEDGTHRRVANTMTPTNHQYTTKTFVAESEEELGNEIKRECPDRAIIEYEFNEEFTPDENIHRATSITNKLVMMKVQGNSALIQLMWKEQKILPKNKPVYIVGYRNRISTNLDSY